MPAGQLIVADDQGRDKSPLRDGAIVPSGVRVRCQAGIGPVEFWLDAAFLRTEAAAPFSPTGDTHGIPNPLVLAPGPHVLTAVAWGSKQVAQARFTVQPAPTPTPTPTPTP